MFDIINCILLILFVYYSRKIFTPAFARKRIVALPRAKGKCYQINPLMCYLIFVVCTAPFFLGSVSLVKYAVYFITLLVLINKGYIVKKFDSIVLTYLLFLCWLIITSLWSPYPYNGLMLIIKYCIPLLSLWLGYSAIKSPSDFFFCSKYVTKASLIYALFLGGLSAVFTPALYFFLANIFITYAGLADYFTSIAGLFLVLAWITNKKKYYLGFLWLLLSTVLEVVRTGLGGLSIVGAMFFFIRYKIKAIPAIFSCIIIFLCIVLYVPQVNEKFFGSNAGYVTIADIVKGDAMSSDNIQTSGRDELWANLLDKFYEPNQISGAGLGASTGYLKDNVRGYTESDIVLIHSDYVQILCDSGIVGVVLLCIFYLAVFLKAGKVAFSNGMFYSKITAALSVASMAGIAFSMGYDNVVSHSMTSLINPFIFIGFFLKFSNLKL